jgi:hypothetical protein
MLKLKISLEGDINIDKFEVEVDCPRCSFANPVWLRQARLRDVVICRGCKANIQLDDGMNTVRKAYRSIRRSMQELCDTVDRLNRNFR